VVFFPVPMMADVLAMPPETPIACQICKPAAASTGTFSGTVRLADGVRLGVFDGKTHQTMAFSVPAGFHGVRSSDGVIKDATLASVVPGLLARVTYQTVAGHHVPSEILLLTLEQCRALQAAERLTRARSDCPD
jgi:hypothetical protein